MTVNFNGRVAIVTGAGSGIGRMYAKLLAARGAKVVVNDLGGGVQGQGQSSALADQVVAEITNAGGVAIANYDSVSGIDSAARIAAAALSAFGRVDALINNAGNLKMAKLAEMAQADIENQINVHLYGAIYCSRAVLPAMQKQKYGRIVLTSSGSGLVGFGTQAPYGAAKAAMVGLMNCIAQEYGSDGVLVNTIVPTATTRMSEGLLWPKMEKFLKPELVAPASVWLASEECQVNGQMFAVAGGHFAKLEIHKAPGVQFDPNKEVTPEMFGEAFTQISDMSGASLFRGTQAAMEIKLKEMGLL